MILRRHLLLLALTLTAWSVVAPPAAGHSVIVGSDPPAGASVDVPPRDLVFQTTEAVDPAFSSVTVLDRSGGLVSERPVFSPDGRQITVPLTTLARGIFTVRWRLLSRVDGHTSSGVYLFAVGQPLAPGGSPGQATPDRLFLIVRWVSYLAAVLLAGSVFFPAAVLRPGLRRFNARDAARLGDVAGRRLRSLTVISALVLLASLAAEVVVGAATLLDVPIPGIATSDALWVYLTATRPGESAVLRLSMLLLLLVPPEPWRWLRWIGLLRPDPVVPGGILLAAMMLTTHASAEGVLAIVADWTHLLAVALWVGGLASLVLVLATAAVPDRGRLAQAVVPRFSAVAGGSLGVVVLTGLYSAWLQVPALRALTATPYGRALLVKLALVTLIVALGAFNRFVVVPRLRGRAVEPERPVARLLRVASGELALGAGVLLIVAVLTALPPARVAMPAVTQSPLVLAGLAKDLQVRLTVTPAKPGWNRFETVVASRAGMPVSTEARVLLRLMKLDENLDVTTVALPRQGQGRYLAEGAQLALPGWWRVELIVRRRGQLDASTVFPLVLGQRPAAPDPAGRYLLEEARAVMAALHSWRQVEQLTDGNGHVVETHYEILQPDRLRYRTSAGGEVMIIGSLRYLRQGSGAWDKESVPPLRSADVTLAYTDGAAGVALGREGQCDDEPCRVVLWTLPDAQASFAAWIGTRTHRVRTLLMVAPGHDMTIHLVDFNAPFLITPPRP